MSNPTISNSALVSRERGLAVAVPVIIDGTTISADGVLKRGTVLVKSGTKYHVFVHGTDTLALDGVAILQDDVKVLAGIDIVSQSAFYEGFFLTAALLDANSAGGLVLADLTLAAGFHVVNASEIRLK
jgi:hypothetical protein